MSLANKKFKNNLTGEIVQVIDSFEHIAILENKQKIDVNTLMNPNLYTEEIDINNFFHNQNSYNLLANKIKNIDTTYLSDDTSGSIPGTETYDVSNESAIVMGSEEDERAALAAKYGASIDNYSSTSKQNEAFAEILGDEAIDELPHLPQPPRTYQNQEQNDVQRIDVNRDTPTKQINDMRIEEDPIIKMFKGVKRSVDFKINLSVDGKIPRLDFIEMMEDSYEKSIIDFLSDEFTNSILKDPDSLRERIKTSLMMMVYSDSDRVKKVKEVDKKIDNKISENVNSSVEEKSKRKYTRKKNETE